MKLKAIYHPQCRHTIIPLNLQFFAEPGGEPGAEPGGEPGEPGEPGGQLFSQEELNEIISKRLSKERGKWEKDFKKQLEEEKKEAERLANLNAEQRKEEEYKKKLKEVEDKAKELRLQEEKIEAAKILTERGLASDFVHFLIGEDSQTTLDNINNFEKMYKEALKAEIGKRLPSGTPNVGGGNGVNGEGLAITKEQYAKLSLSEKNKLYIENPEAVKELMKK